MNIRARFLLIPRGILIAAVWLCGMGPAWAGGGGGEDAATVQSFLDGICNMVGQSPCPQLPTISQGVLEIAGLFNARPEAVRYGQNVPGAAVYANNPPAPAPTPQSPLALSSLTPLAFIGAPTSQGHATPTQLYDPAANSFFYAVTTIGSVQGSLQPQTLHLFFDYLPRIIPIFIKDEVVAKISLPLVVLNSDGTERAVCGAKGCPASVATLKIAAVCTGGAACLKATIQGDFAGTGAQPNPTYPASDLGVTFSLAFGPSPLSKFPHTTFEVQVPLVVTALNDAPYFAFNFVLNTIPFSADDTGTLAPVLGAGVSVGIPPYAGPPCSATPGTPCPIPPAPAPASTFGFCASFANTFSGRSAPPSPAVAAFLQIATDGETLASAPLSFTPPPGSPPPPPLLCPF